MRIGTAAIASALLLAVSHAAHAAPSINLQDGVQAPAGMVDLVRKGGGGGGKGKGVSGRGFSGKSIKGGRAYGGRSYGGRSYAGRSFKGSGRNFKGYSGRSYRGGSRYAYAGKGRYGNSYNKGRYYRRGYPYFWGGLALSGAYYGGNCGWLYRQAQATGSAYWWQRYQDCTYSY